MPLEGFRIVHWASQTFGRLPAPVLGGIAVAMLVAGAIIAVAGIRQHPTSWALLAAGVSVLVLTYFVGGAAIGRASDTLVGSEQVAGSAARVVPWAAAVAAVGLGLFALRTALNAWSSDQPGGKVTGVLLAACALAGVFIGVQIARGPRSALVVPDDPSATPPRGEYDDDGPVRRRGVGPASRP
jgi:hypothetical protein